MKSESIEQKLKKAVDFNIQQAKEFPHFVVTLTLTRFD